MSGCMNTPETVMTSRAPAVLTNRRTLHHHICAYTYIILSTSGTSSLPRIATTPRRGGGRSLWWGFVSYFLFFSSQAAFLISYSLNLKPDLLVPFLFAFSRGPAWWVRGHRRQQAWLRWWWGQLLSRRPARLRHRAWRCGPPPRLWQRPPEEVDQHHQRHRSDPTTQACQGEPGCQGCLSPNSPQGCRRAAQRSGPWDRPHLLLSHCGRLGSHRGSI